MRLTIQQVLTHAAITLKALGEIKWYCIDEFFEFGTNEDEEDTDQFYILGQLHEDSLWFDADFVWVFQGPGNEARHSCNVTLTNQFDEEQALTVLRGLLAKESITPGGAKKH